MQSNHNSIVQDDISHPTEHSVHSKLSNFQQGQAMQSKHFSQIPIDGAMVSKAMSFHGDVGSKALSFQPIVESAYAVGSKISVSGFPGYTSPVENPELVAQVVQELQEVQLTGDLGRLSKAAMDVLSKHLSKVSHHSVGC
jgi:hypothetical protein